MTPAAFKTKWAKFSGKESAAYAEHFNDLCRMLPADVRDDEILSRLLALNLARAAAEHVPAIKTIRRKPAAKDERQTEMEEIK